MRKELEERREVLEIPSTQARGGCGIYSLIDIDLVLLADEITDLKNFNIICR